MKASSLELRADAPVFRSAFFQPPTPSSSLGNNSSPIDSVSSLVDSLSASPTSAMSSRSSSFGSADRPRFVSSPKNSNLSSPRSESPCSAELEEAKNGDDLTDNYLYHRYVSLFEKALLERSVKGPGNSPLMRSMFPFWRQR